MAFGFEGVMKLGGPQAYTRIEVDNRATSEVGQRRDLIASIRHTAEVGTYDVRSSRPRSKVA
ncbi:hypothetical protein MMC22_003247 [Lobaria immixta]|nr:hypothetical protein [Lobaria immixta]